MEGPNEPRYTAARVPGQRHVHIFGEATDANGDELEGHELALTLSTTGEYTGS